MPAANVVIRLDLGKNVQIIHLKWGGIKTTVKVKEMEKGILAIKGQNDEVGSRNKGNENSE